MGLGQIQYSSHSSRFPGSGSALQKFHAVINNHKFNWDGKLGQRLSSYVFDAHKLSKRYALLYIVWCDHTPCLHLLLHFSCTSWRLCCSWESCIVQENVATCFLYQFPLSMSNTLWQDTQFNSTYSYWANEPHRGGNMFMPGSGF